MLVYDFYNPLVGTYVSIRERNIGHYHIDTTWDSYYDQEWLFDEIGILWEDNVKYDLGIEDLCPGYDINEEPTSWGCDEYSLSLSKAVSDYNIDTGVESTDGCTCSMGGSYPAYEDTREGSLPNFGETVFLYGGPFITYYYEVKRECPSH